MILFQTKNERKVFQAEVAKCLAVTIQKRAWYVEGTEITRRKCQNAR
jgi:hypothetical protein